jgi:LacI family transcriptional regulator
MTRRGSTLKDLAAKLDLSVATVSRALGGYADIAASTRERVISTARELGYVPNSAGRMLVSGKSGFVGLVIPIRGPYLVDAFLGEFVTGLGEGLNNQGTDLFLATVQDNQNELDVLKHVVESGRADGVVLNRVAEADERVEYLRSRNFPFVAHGRVLNEAGGHHWLDTDGGAAFGEAWELLYELGHRRFGLLTINDPMTFRHYRERGLNEAIAERADPDVELQTKAFTRFDDLALRGICADMLSAPNRPTAILCLSDEIALVLVEEAARRGISIPGDLSVIGFDNLPASAYVSPALTTFDQDIRGSAKQLASMLMNAISNPQIEAQTRLIKPKLFRRASHGPVQSL